MIEQYYLWLCLIPDLSYEQYLQLMKIFKNVNALYISSKDQKTFYHVIKKSQMLLSKNLFDSFTSEKIKEKADKIYSYFMKSCIQIISIDSKYYPKSLYASHFVPFALFYQGDIQVLEQFCKKKKIFLLQKDLSSFAKKVKQYFKPALKDKFLWIGQEEDVDILLVQKDIFSLEHYECTSPSFIIPYEWNLSKILLDLVDYFFMIESEYNKEVKEMVEYFIEQGKEILVVPGNIFYKQHYFSNYLIQEGATVLLNRKDIESL